jgi:uncharacterized membrane protein YadS
MLRRRDFCWALQFTTWRRPQARGSPSRLKQGKSRPGRATILPGFVIAFIGLAIANSFRVIPLSVVDTIKPLTSAALLMAIAAVGIKTSIPAVMEVGATAIMTVLIETLFLLGLVVTCVIILL